jgi:hypothetical protein
MIISRLFGLPMVLIALRLGKQLYSEVIGRAQIRKGRTTSSDFRFELKLGETDMEVVKSQTAKASAEAKVWVLNH